jgi:hypothetical protein
VLAIPRRRRATLGSKKGYAPQGRLVAIPLKAIPGCVIAAYLRKIAAELAASSSTWFVQGFARTAQAWPSCHRLACCHLRPITHRRSDST